MTLQVLLLSALKMQLKFKKVGRLANLEAIVKADPNEGTVGIGHTVGLHRVVHPI